MFPGLERLLHHGRPIDTTGAVVAPESLKPDNRYTGNYELNETYAKARAERAKIKAMQPPVPPR